MKDECQPVQIDADGTTWWNFGFEYDWDGTTYVFDIAARSREEADARLKRMPLARYIGQRDGAPIPVSTASRIWVPLLVWWRNIREKE